MKNIFKEKITIKKYDISFYLTLFIIALHLLYPLNTVIPNFIQIPSFLVWLAILGKSKILFSKIVRNTFIYYVFLIIILIRVFYSGNLNQSYFTPLTVVIECFQIVVMFSLYLYIESLGKQKQKKVINFCINCIMISVAFSLYYVFFVDSQAIRNTQREFLWGVGDFQLMYALAIFIGPYTKTAFNSRKKTDMVYCFLIWICLLKCNLVTSLVIAFFSMILTMLFNSKEPLLNCTVFSALLFLFIWIKNEVAKFLIEIASMDFFYWSTQNKIIAIANLLTGGSDIDTLGDRASLMKQSWNSFLANPFFGINYKDYKQGTIGQHSQWIDELARLGLIGTILLIVSLLNIFIMIQKNLNNGKSKFNFLAGVISFVTLGFLNPTIYGTNLIVVMIVIPFLNLRFSII